MNREAWLTEVAKRVEPYFQGFHLGPYRVTCGWPCRHALGMKARRVGECHAGESSTGGFHEIFISPLLADPLEVAGTLTHELAHVAAGIDAGHGRRFVKVCKHVGLTKGKPTSVMPGSFLQESLARIVDHLGAYPHTAMDPKGKLKIKSASSFRLICAKCGCKITISKNWLSKAGNPTCGCGGAMGLGEEGDDGGE